MKMRGIKKIYQMFDEVMGILKNETDEKIIFN